MVGILEVGKISFESYKKDIVAAILFSLAMILITFLGIIPIIGAFILAYLHPRILGWYYNKTIGNIKPNYRLAFKIFLIWYLIIHIALILVLGLAFGSVFGAVSSLMLGSKALNIAGILTTLLGALIILPIVIIIVSIIFYYPAFASVLGKIEKIEIDIKKSLILLVYLIVWGILFTILAFIIGMIPIIGPILTFILQLFLFNPLSNLIAAHKVLSM